MKGISQACRESSASARSAVLALDGAVGNTRTPYRDDQRRSSCAVLNRQHRPLFCSLPKTADALQKATCRCCVPPVNPSMHQRKSGRRIAARHPSLYPTGASRLMPTIFSACPPVRYPFFSVSQVPSSISLTHFMEVSSATPFPSYMSALFVSYSHLTRHCTTSMG